MQYATSDEPDVREAAAYDYGDTSNDTADWKGLMDDLHQLDGAGVMVRS